MTDYGKIDTDKKLDRLLDRVKKFLPERYGRTEAERLIRVGYETEILASEKSALEGHISDLNSAKDSLSAMEARILAWKKSGEAYAKNVPLKPVVMQESEYRQIIQRWQEKNHEKTNRSKIQIEVL